MASSTSVGHLNDAVSYRTVAVPATSISAATHRTPDLSAHTYPDATIKMLENIIVKLQGDMINLQSDQERMRDQISLLKMKPYSSESNADAYRDLLTRFHDEQSKVELPISEIHKKFAEIEDRISRLNPNFGRF